MSESSLAILQATARGLAAWLERALIALMGMLVLVVLWGVLTRGLSWILPQQVAPSRWTEEAAETLLMWVALLGAAVAFDRRAHLGVDYFANQLDPAARRILQVIVLLVSAAFAAAALAYGGSILVREALASGQLTPALQVSKGYVYLAAPISGVLIVLFCLEQAAELLGAPPAHAETSPEREERT